LKAHVGGVTVHAVAQALRTSFETHFGADFETTVPEEHERTAARELGARYVDAEFVRRR
jgi:hypothetical protein